MGGLPPITALKRVSVALMETVHGCGTPLVEGARAALPRQILGVLATTTYQYPLFVTCDE